MLVIGAQGHAKDILSVLDDNGLAFENLYFYDDVNKDLPDKLFNIYPIIKSFSQACQILSQSQDFILGIGSPKTRQLLNNKFFDVGGKPCSLISKKAIIGRFDVKLGEGVTIMSNVIITNCVTIGEGALINAGVLIHHDVKIGKFVEVSPGAILTGQVEVDDFSFVGAGATILPKVKIGKNVIIGAGAVVTKSVPDNMIIKGNPAKSF